MLVFGEEAKSSSKKFALQPVHLFIFVYVYMDGWVGR